MNPNIIERVAGFFSHEWGVRMMARRMYREYGFGGKRGYEGASAGRLAHNWFSQSSTTDAIAYAQGQILRDRSRDAVRNNPVAAKIVNEHANYFLGDGISIRFKGEDEALKQRVLELWLEWWKFAFTAGTLDGNGMLRMMIRMMVQDGEVFLRRRIRRREDGLPVPMQLEVLDSEFCDWKRNSVFSGGNPVTNGIEFDAIGRRRGYWMYRHNPLSTSIHQLGNLDSVFIPASDICHLYEPQSNQTRGVPWLSPVLTDLKEIRDYIVAENVRKKAEACLVGVITPAEDDQTDPNIGLAETQHGEGSAPLVDVNGFPVDRMEPGMFAVAKPGSSITFNTPAITPNTESYIRSRYRDVASGARIPYELITGDYSQANFASGQLGLIAYERFVDAVQWQLLIPQVMRRIVEWFLEAAVLDGTIPRDHGLKFEFQPPEFKVLGRLDQSKADLLDVRMGKRSLHEIVGKTGRDVRDVLQEIAETNRLSDELGLTLDSDPRRVSAVGVAQLVEATGNETQDAGSAASGAG